MRRIITRSMLRASGVVAVSFLCAGCIGLNDRGVIVGRTTTLESELRDLKRALEVGAVTEAEYRDVKTTLERRESRVLYTAADDDG